MFIWLPNEKAGNRPNARREQGSSAFVALGSIAAISLAALYVSNLRSRAKRDIDITQRENLRIDALDANVSSFAVLRGLFNDRLIAPGIYQPAVYPQNYFDNTWKLTENSTIALPSAAVNNSTVSVSTFGPSESWFPQKADKILLGKASAQEASGLFRMQPINIVALRRDDPEKPYYVNAIDVEIPADSSGSARIASRARIPLRAPTPGNIEVWVKEEKEAVFTQNFGTESSPRKAGKYYFQVKGAGVVYYAEVTVDGKAQTIGLSAANKIEHNANNVKSPMQIIGTSKMPLSVGSVPQSGTCPGGSTSAAIPLSAKLVGVDGNVESPGGIVDKELFVESAAGLPAYTEANFVPAMISAADKKEYDCVAGANPRIWDGLKLKCTDFPASTNCDYFDSQMASPAGKAIIADARTNPKRKILNCAKSKKKAIAMFEILEITGTCQLSLYTQCEYAGLPSQGNNQDMAKCLEDF